MADVSGKFCLKWKDFKDSLASGVGSLRNDFSDVTLVCEDTKIQADRLVLTASSPFFSSVLRMMEHPKPMIYMKGVKAMDMKAILDFIYKGEATVLKEDLETFMALAEELEMNGLSKRNSELVEDDKTPKFRSKDLEIKEDVSEQIDWNIPPSQDYQIEDTLKHDETIRSMILKNEETAMFSCKACGKLLKSRFSTVNHIETKHIQGLSHPCNHCSKVSKSREGLRQHITANHSDAKQLKFIPFPCNMCDKGSVSKDGLRQHMKSNHTQIKI